jgi:hypothetical protein
MRHGPMLEEQWRTCLPESKHPSRFLALTRRRRVTSREWLVLQARERKRELPGHLVRCGDRHNGSGRPGWRSALSPQKTQRIAACGYREFRQAMPLGPGGFMPQGRVISYIGVPVLSRTSARCRRARGCGCGRPTQAAHPISKSAGQFVTAVIRGPMTSKICGHSSFLMAS